MQQWLLVLRCVVFNKLDSNVGALSIAVSFRLLFQA
jgi:hypothetical protein